MIAGFTGTRYESEITAEHRKWARQALIDYGITEVHHGGCTGGDGLGHRVALELGIPVIVHPPIKQSWVDPIIYEPNELVTVLSPKSYFVRDVDVVTAADRMLAIAQYGMSSIPADFIKANGGTAFTCGVTLKQKKWLDVCWPSGKVVKY